MSLDKASFVDPLDRSFRVVVLKRGNLFTPLLRPNRVALQVQYRRARIHDAPVLCSLP